MSVNRQTILLLRNRPVVRALKDKGYANLVCSTSTEIDLRSQADVESFFEKEEEKGQVFNFDVNQQSI